MQRLGILGGTFDPVHIGHLVFAGEVHRALELDSVVLVPAGDPWQKSNQVVASTKARLDMLNLVAAEDSRFVVSSVDIDRAGPTYAIDTVTDLALQHPDSQFEFIVGSDAYLGIDTWKDHEKLLDLVNIVVARRPGDTSSQSDIPQSFAGPGVTEVQVPLLDVSSTNLRQRISGGDSIQYLVPESVRTYISENGIYS